MTQKKIYIHTFDPLKENLLDYAMSLKGFSICLKEEDADIMIIDFKLRDFLFRRELSIPVIVIGKYSDEDEILQGIYRYYSDYVLEPFEISELEMILDKNLYRKELKQTLSSFRIENMGYL